MPTSGAIHLQEATNNLQVFSHPIADCHFQCLPANVRFWVAPH
jgi:hypothetical protein